MYIKMLIFADSLFVESVTVKFRKYGEISVLYLCLLFLFSRCGKGKSESEEVPFNPYVEAFTSGTISRYTPVYLIFNQEIAVDRMEPDQLRDLSLIHI